MPFQVILVLYVMAFCYIMYRSSFFQLPTLDRKVLPVFFLLKVAAGIVYGYIHYSSQYGAQTDTWKFYYQSLQETDLLYKNPLAFLQSIFGNGYGDANQHIAATTNNYWNDLKHNIMLFIMSIFNILSAKSYYVNVVLYNAFTMIGVLYFLKFCIKYFPQIPGIIILVILCLPSVLFWTSGFHKEGILFSAIALLLYSCHCIVQHHRYILASIVTALMAWFILLLRSYYFILLIPFVFVWVVSHYVRFKNSSVLLYLAVLVGICAVFIFSGYLPSYANLVQFMAKGHQELAALGGNMAIHQPLLEANTDSFVRFFPHALRNAFLEPNIFHTKKTYWLFTAENIFLLIGMLAAIIFAFKQKQSSTFYLFLLLPIVVFVFIGYTVPNTGALIRYKSVFIPFLTMAIASVYYTQRQQNSKLFFLNRK